MTACEECRKREATLSLSYQVRCRPVLRRLCQACARAAQLSVPFTLTPLPPPRA